MNRDVSDNKQVKAAIFSKSEQAPPQGQDCYRS